MEGDLDLDGERWLGDLLALLLEAELDRWREVDDAALLFVLLTVAPEVFSAVVVDFDVADGFFVGFSVMLFLADAFLVFPAVGGFLPAARIWSADFSADLIAAVNLDLKSLLSAFTSACCKSVSALRSPIFSRTSCRSSEFACAVSKAEAAKLWLSARSCVSVGVLPSFPLLPALSSSFSVLSLLPSVFDFRRRGGESEWSVSWSEDSRRSSSTGASTTAGWYLSNSCWARAFASPVTSNSR